MEDNTKYLSAFGLLLEYGSDNLHLQQLMTKGIFADKMSDIVV